jgi:hypothetical protein
MYLPYRGISVMITTPIIALVALIILGTLFGSF